MTAFVRPTSDLSLECDPCRRAPRYSAIDDRGQMAGRLGAGPRDCADAFTVSDERRPDVSSATGGCTLAHLLDRRDSQSPRAQSSG